jgi:hypothetical protein
VIRHPLHWAHARTGDRVAISTYLGEDDRFLHALTDLAHAYADLNESDHEASRDAVERGALAPPRDLLLRAGRQVQRTGTNRTVETMTMRERIQPSLA